MSERESEQPTPSKLAEADDPRATLRELLGRIRANAVARVPEVEEPDTRALEGEDNLASVGETWLRQEISHTKHLHYVRLFLLASLFVLVLAWLGSVAFLLLLQGFKLWAFWLTDKVIITYITSTTVSVLGLFHIAAKWLFSAGLRTLRNHSQTCTTNQVQTTDRCRFALERLRTQNLLRLLVQTRGFAGLRV